MVSLDTGASDRMIGSSDPRNNHGQEPAVLSLGFRRDASRGHTLGTARNATTLSVPPPTNAAALPGALLGPQRAEELPPAERLSGGDTERFDPALSA